MGLSFGELNCLTVDDYIAFVDMWVDDDDGYRRATQDDINSMLG
jgi:hypothetical protein